MEDSANLPLAGVTVVELCHSVAGPYAGSILADLGADVIKVEAPDKGDYARDWGPPFAHGTSTLFHVLNHNKRGLALDLRDRVTRERLIAFILDHADVVLQNMRPGAVDKLGLGAAALRAQKPALITCDLGAYGRSGPLKDRPGYDPLMQAHGGIMSVTGIEGGEPVRVGVSIVDQGAGMWAALGILAALNKRHVTGEVRLKLYKGSSQVVGRKGPHQLYQLSLATYGKGDEFDQSAAAGFIKLWGMGLRTSARVQGRLQERDLSNLLVDVKRLAP